VMANATMLYCSAGYTENNGAIANFAWEYCGLAVSAYRL
jgi:hypothetical protein